jgi:hypothetical protein
MEMEGNMNISNGCKHCNEPHDPGIECRTQTVEPGTPDALAAYHRLDLWGDYLKAKQVWEAAHHAYCSGSTEPLLRELRRTCCVKDELLAELRKTPEHVAAFGW